MAREIRVSVRRVDSLLDFALTPPVRYRRQQVRAKGQAHCLTDLPCTSTPVLPDCEPRASVRRSYDVAAVTRAAKARAAQETSQIVTSGRPRARARGAGTVS